VQKFEVQSYLNMAQMVRLDAREIDVNLLISWFDHVKFPISAVAAVVCNK
jgi:hypothetical protein